MTSGFLGGLIRPNRLFGVQRRGNVSRMPWLFSVISLLSLVDRVAPCNCMSHVHCLHICQSVDWILFGLLLVEYYHYTIQFCFVSMKPVNMYTVSSLLPS